MPKGEYHFLKSQLFNAIDQCDEHALRLTLQNYSENVQSVKNAHGESPLIYTARTSNNINILNMLLPFSNLEDRDDYDRTALYEAVLHEKTSFIQLLMNVGADPDVIIKDRYSCNTIVTSPRKYAKHKGYYQILTILDGTDLKPARGFV